jgi:acyl transferase domain-containing protein
MVRELPILADQTYLTSFVAGMPMEQVLGTKTAVFTGSFADDTMLIGSRDLENLPKYACTGWASTMLSNRVSWFFGLTGPSVNLDSACSSSMMALDMGCQALRSGDASMVSC